MWPPPLAQSWRRLRFRPLPARSRPHPSACASAAHTPSPDRHPWPPSPRHPAACPSPPPCHGRCSAGPSARPAGRSRLTAGWPRGRTAASRRQGQEQPAGGFAPGRAFAALSAALTCTSSRCASAPTCAASVSAVRGARAVRASAMAARTRFIGTGWHRVVKPSRKWLRRVCQQSVVPRRRSMTR